MKGTRRYIRLFIVFASAAFLSAGGLLTVDATILTTKHNLSTSGPGPIKATSEDQVCVFCHTPHGAVTTPLWNHTLSTVSYQLPAGTMASWRSMLSTPQNPPDGDSRLCLSCHDGTVAVGSVVNLRGASPTVAMQGTEGGKIPASYTTSLGTDLSGHHPVSIEVSSSLLSDKGEQCNNNLVSMRICTPQPPLTLRPTANLYVKGPHTGVGIQCSTCHDAHDNSRGAFLRSGAPGNTTDLCTRCHISCTETCP
ncbi:MAG: hypothetical protein HGA78_01820 [Nitrospirales bacterium]|nr:hypothetical protein [Nitrospirales bacterium]